MRESKHNPQAATIREIARRAEVSIASVSRALNGKPGLSEALRDKILAISREVAYQPSAAARQLISGKAAVVGISLGRQDIELRPYYILLYQHLTVALHQQGRLEAFADIRNHSGVHHDGFYTQYIIFRPFLDDCRHPQAPKDCS